MLALFAAVGTAFLVSNPAVPRVMDLSRLERPMTFEPVTVPETPAALVRLARTRPMPHPHELFVATLRWGMLHSAHVDDVMLALVSPETYWVLRCWRKVAFGDVESLRRSLVAARRQLLSGGVVDGELRRQVSSVSVRGKGLWSTFHKAAVRRKDVHDVMALRVVIRGDDEHCMRVLDAVREKWPSVDGRFKDYIRSPKKNGYQALHDTVLLPSGQPVEIQIRTEEMHARAEYGSAAHRRYKGALYELPRTMLTGVVLGRRPTTSLKDLVMGALA